MQQDINIAAAVGKWTRGRLNFRSSFYTGRGVTTGDLNSSMLEQIYQGLKADVGQKEATNFAKFVWKLKDLSASAFIQALEQFWHEGCPDQSPEQRAGTGNEMTAHGEDRYTEAFALIGQAFGGRRASAEEIEQQSLSLKMSFCRNHEKELGEKLKGPYKSQGTRIYSHW